MTEPESGIDPDMDSGMDSGSDAGRPGDRALPPDDAFVEESEAAARAAADEAPLPAEGGPQDDGLAPEFSQPEF